MDKKCHKCESLCSSRGTIGNEKTCSNLSTTHDSIFVTVYGTSAHHILKIEFGGENLLNLIKFGTYYHKKLKTMIVINYICNEF